MSLKIYPAPHGVVASPDYAVWVNGLPAFVYHTPIASLTTFAFDPAATGAVTVEIRARVLPLEPPIIRPLHRGIVAEMDADAVRVVLPVPQNVAVEFAGLPPLYLFASRPETDKPDPADPAVHYFAAGQVYNAGDFLHLTDGQTVYIEGGAVLKSTAIRAANAKNIAVRGHGLIDGSGLPAHSHRLLAFAGCRGVRVEDVVCVGSPSWNLVFGACDAVEVSGIRVLTWQVTGDGMDVVGSQNVRITDCFLRTNDDCVAVKSVNYGAGEDADDPNRVDWRGDVRNILVERCVLHNDRAGNVLEIGFETQCDVIENVVFRDCDVIAAHGYGGVFTIHNGDRATVRDVLYEAIRVEHAFDFLVDIRVLHSRYSSDAARGRIENIAFKDIFCAADPHNCVSVIGGFDAAHTVSGVVFENFNRNGEPVRDADDLHLFTKRVHDVSFG